MKHLHSLFSLFVLLSVSAPANAQEQTEVGPPASTSLQTTPVSGDESLHDSKGLEPTPRPSRSPVNFYRLEAGTVALLGTLSPNLTFFANEHFMEDSGDLNFSLLYMSSASLDTRWRTATTRRSWLATLDVGYQSQRTGSAMALLGLETPIGSVQGQPHLASLQLGLISSSSYLGFGSDEYYVDVASFLGAARAHTRVPLSTSSRVMTALCLEGKAVFDLMTTRIYHADGTVSESTRPNAYNGSFKVGLERSSRAKRRDVLRVVGLDLALLWERSVVGGPYNLTASLDLHLGLGGLWHR